jgi:hypothetical protein
MGIHLVVPSYTLLLSELMMVFGPDIQLPRPKPLHSLSEHDVNMQWGKCVFLFLFQFSTCRDLVFSSLLQNTLFGSCSRLGCTSAQLVLTTPTCACAVPSGIRSSVRVAHARERTG